MMSFLITSAAVILHEISETISPFGSLTYRTLYRRYNSFIVRQKSSPGNSNLVPVATATTLEFSTIIFSLSATILFQLSLNGTILMILTEN